jgi:hypothetical protein
VAGAPRIVAALAAAALLLAPMAATAADLSRGRALYELRCQGCHAESVHARAKREARDFEAVRRWVERWNASLQLRWEAQEVDDVAFYLNDTFYRYPCPTTVCKIVSLR